MMQLTLLTCAEIVVTLLRKTSETAGGVHQKIRAGWPNGCFRVARETALRLLAWYG
jgi:hypothetical protein